MSGAPPKAGLARQQHCASPSRCQCCSSNGRRRLTRSIQHTTTTTLKPSDTPATQAQWRQARSGALPSPKPAGSATATEHRQCPHNALATAANRRCPRRSRHSAVNTSRRLPTIAITRRSATWQPSHATLWSPAISGAPLIKAHLRCRDSHRQSHYRHQPRQRTANPSTHHAARFTRRHVHQPRRPSGRIRPLPRLRHPRHPRTSRRSRRPLPSRIVKQDV